MDNMEQIKLNRDLAKMLKGGVIMDVTTPEQAKVAEAAGACALMALERIPADIRAAGGVSRMSDPKMIKEIQREIAKFEKEFEDLRIRTLLSGEYDSCNAIVTLHAGAGGTGKGKDNIQVCRCGLWNSQYF